MKRDDDRTLGFTPTPKLGKQPDRSLDYATRKLISDTCRETIRAELSDAAMFMQLADERPQLLHGPCSLAAEALVIGAVLVGEIPLSSIPLQPSDFWAGLNGRFWKAMRHAMDPEDDVQLLIPRIVSSLDRLGLVTGPLCDFETELYALRDSADILGAFHDVSAAVMLVLEHSRARRLGNLMVTLAAGLCNGGESHETAYQQLREHFATERGNLIRDH